MIIPTVRSENASDKRSQFPGFRNNLTRLSIIKITTPLQTNVTRPFMALRTQKYAGTGPQKKANFLESRLLLESADMMMASVAASCTDGTPSGDANPVGKHN